MPPDCSSTLRQLSVRVHFREGSHPNSGDQILFVFPALWCTRKHRGKTKKKQKTSQTWIGLNFRVLSPHIRVNGFKTLRLPLQQKFSWSSSFCRGDSAESARRLSGGWEIISSITDLSVHCLEIRTRQDCLIFSRGGFCLSGDFETRWNQRVAHELRHFTPRVWRLAQHRWRKRVCAVRRAAQKVSGEVVWAFHSNMCPNRISTDKTEFKCVNGDLLRICLWSRRVFECVCRFSRFIESTLFSF